MKAIYPNKNKKQNAGQLGMLLFLLFKINQSFAGNSKTRFNSSKLKLSVPVQFLTLVGYNVEFDSEPTTGFTSVEVII
jgi:hypothetical protein